MSHRTLFLLRRVVLTIPVLFVMSGFVFLIPRLVPGDPVQTLLGLRVDPKLVQALRHQLGLDQPLTIQYANWFWGVIHGNLGNDLVTGAPVRELILQRMPVTLELTLAAMAVSLALGIPLGAAAATGRKAMRTINEGIVVAGITIPDFWLGMMLVLLFSGAAHLLPPSGYAPLLTDPLQNLRYFVLPVAALALGRIAWISRTTQSVLEDTLKLPFVVYLRAKGVPEAAVTYSHGLRASAPPIITTIGIQFGNLLGGAIIVESLFGLPGLGSLVVRGILDRNYTVIQGSVMVIAALFILVNLVTDLFIGWFDPRAGESMTA